MLLFRWRGGHQAVLRINVKQSIYQSIGVGNKFIVVKVSRSKPLGVFPKQDQMEGASNWADKVICRVCNDQLLFKCEQFGVDLYVPLLDKIVVMSRIIRRSGMRESFILVKGPPSGEDETESR